MKALKIMSVLFLLITSACGGSENNNKSFNQYTNEIFSVTEDSTPADVDAQNFIFDVEENESVFDTIVANGSFSS